MSFTVALIVGLTLGLSSTAFAVQLMNEQGIMAGPLGRKGFSILLLQGLAVIPVLLLVSWLAPQQLNAHHGAPWWMGIGVITLVLLVSRFLLTSALRIIAQYGSREVFTVATLLIVLGKAWLMQLAGLTMGMGALLILTNLGYTQTQASAIIRQFREHDERAIRDASEHKNDLPQLIKLADQGRKELKTLYQSDKQ